MVNLNHKLTFSNIIEITSSGGLHQEIIRVFKDSEFVELIGSGVQRILSEYEKVYLNLVLIF